MLATFLLGFLSALGALVAGLYFVLTTRGDGPPRRRVRVSFEHAEEDAGEEEQEEPPLGQEEWLNSIIQRIFSEITQNSEFRQDIRKKIEIALNKGPAELKKTSGLKARAISLLGRIQLQSIDLGLKAPRLTRMKQNEHGGVDFYFRWVGNCRIKIKTKVQMPLDNSRFLPLSGTVLLTRIEGPATFRIPDDENPLWKVAFVREPSTDLSVSTEMGSLLSLVSVPQVDNTIKRRIIGQISKQFVLGTGGLVGRIPIKHRRKAQIMTLIKYNKLLAEKGHIDDSDFEIPLPADDGEDDEAKEGDETKEDDKDDKEAAASSPEEERVDLPRPAPATPPPEVPARRARSTPVTPAKGVPPVPTRIRYQ